VDLENPFSVGDVVMCSDKQSPFFRRDSVVVYNDYSIFAVMSEGLSFISFCSVADKTFTLVKRGAGKLSPEHNAMLVEVLKNWGPVQLLKTFPAVLDRQKEQITEKDEKVVPLHITAFVPETMARVLREFSALIELSKAVNPGFNRDPHQMVLEWMILSITQIMPLMLAAKIREQNEEEDKNE
jgi:hypothetical protein